MPVDPIPQGYTALSPYLIVRGAAQAIEFYKKVFHAVEIMRMPDPQGKIGHAEIRIADSVLMLADEFPERRVVGPESLGNTSVHFLLYVPDVDSAFARAIQAGGKEIKPVQDQFYGDRCGTFCDPFGHQWTVATHIEDLSNEEMDRRFREQSSKP